MQIGLAILAIISLAFLNASGGLAPERLSVAEAGENQSVQQSIDANVAVSQRTQADRTNSVKQTPPVATEEIVADYRPPVVKSYTARNIEADNALVRGKVDMHDYKGGTVYVVYGYNRNQVESLVKTNQASDRSFKSQDDRARVTIIDLNPRGEESYEKRISRLVSEADYYYQICLEYTDLADKQSIICSTVETFSTSPESSLRNRFQAPRISADRALYVTDGEASVSVRLRMNDGIDGTPFIVYGLFKEFVDEVDSRYSSYSSVREYDEDLQKERLGVRRLGQSEYKVEFDDLEDDSKYYYRACVEYDGKKEGLVCDGTRSFETDNQNKSSKPTVKTNGPVTFSNGARLSGNIRMGDFMDGYAFFVYGTNQEKVKNVETEDSFNRIRQSVDALQKIALSDDVDGQESISFKVRDLKIGQIYHYRLCVQYVDQNKYGREGFFLNCGEVRSWVSL
jgi:hypothetical protein